MRWPKLKDKQERTSCFFMIPLLLLLLSLPFFLVLCKNVIWQYDFYDEGRYSEIVIMKTRRTVYLRKNTRIGSSFLVFHYPLQKETLGKSILIVYSREKFEVRMA